jgi:hypothetical protein
MLKLHITGFRWDRELQLIQADVCLTVGGRTIIEEALCVDVGLPALAFSLNEDVEPDRFAPPEVWRKKPFFVCGCGDPECRAYVFTVRHESGQGTVRLAEVEERGGGLFRVLEEWELPAGEYKAAVKDAVLNVLEYAEGLDGYKPLFSDTLPIVRQELERACPPLEEA